MKSLLRSTGNALLAATVAVGLLGALTEALRGCDQGKRPERPVEAPELVTRPAGYTGPASCLVWGVGQPESCRGELPECLQEDGSGPGVMCWFTDPDHGKLWLQTGDDPA